MPLTPKQKEALNIFSSNQAELVSQGQAGGHQSTLTGNENSIVLGDILVEQQAWTTSDIILTVSSTGSDVLTSRPNIISGGNYSTSPFLTIQAAVDSLPKIVRHKILIDIGAGTFAGFVMDGFVGSSVYDLATISRSTKRGRIIFRGTTALDTTLATGDNSGFASGGIAGTGTVSLTTQSLTVSTSAWTASDLQNRWIKFVAGPGSSGNLDATGANSGSTWLGETPLQPIWDNGTNYIVTGGINATPTSATQYNIVTLATIIKGPPASGYSDWVIDNNSRAQDVVIVNNSIDLMFYGLKFTTTAPGGTNGPIVVHFHRSRVRLTACEFRGQTSGSSSRQGNFTYIDDINLSYCMQVSSSPAGFFLCGQASMQFCFWNNPRGATLFQDCWNFTLSNTCFHNSQSAPIQAIVCYRGQISNNTIVNGVTGDGCNLSDVVKMTINGLLTPTLPTGYGINIGGYGKYVITVSPTGTTGDMIVDGLLLTHAQRIANVRTISNALEITTTT